MWRSRARLGLCAIVVALAWPAAPAARAATADVGTLKVSPPAVQASTETPLTFSFTAPANPPPAQALVVTMSMPADWTAAPPSSADLACPNSGCSLVAASSTQFAVELVLKLAMTFTLDVQATPPGYAGPASFTAFEQTRGGPYLTGEATAPPVTVTCPDGTGTMTVAPATVTAGSSQTLTFTYTAGSCGAGAGGLVAVTVPGGWTSPNTMAGQPGDTTWAGGQISVTGSTITVPVGQLAPDQEVTFSYQMPQAPGSSGGYTFTAAEQSGTDGTLQDLAASPPVTVTPAGGTATTPAGGGIATTPAGGGTATTPAGGGTATTPAGGGTATTPAVKVTAAHPGIDWPPIVLLVIGLVLAAGTAGRLAFRGLRQGRGHGTVAADVRTVPHTGPPATVIIRDTGRRPALTVRIEPNDSAAVTTIEETRP